MHHSSGLSRASVRVPSERDVVRCAAHLAAHGQAFDLGPEVSERFCRDGLALCARLGHGFPGFGTADLDGLLVLTTRFATERSGRPGTDSTPLLGVDLLLPGARAVAAAATRLAGSGGTPESVTRSALAVRDPLGQPPALHRAGRGLSTRAAGRVAGVERRVPVSRRDRPAKPALSQEGIVAAALELLRTEGLPRVTMRRLAQQLDTGPASLYVYVRDTDELHGLVLDVLLGDVDPAAVAERDGEWRERLWSLVRSYTSVLFAQPALARVALVTRLSGPNYLALVDGALGLLAEGGVGDAQASWAVDALLLMATATAVEQGARAERATTAAQDASLVARIDEASTDRYPHIAAVGRELVRGRGSDRSRWAFDALVGGALATPRT